MIKRREARQTLFGLQPGYNELTAAIKHGLAAVQSIQGIEDPAKAKEQSDALGRALQEQVVWWLQLMRKGERLPIVTVPLKNVEDLVYTAAKALVRETPPESYEKARQALEMALPILVQAARAAQV